MLDELTAEQLAGWEEFYADEPFGPLRDDLRAGIIATMAISPHLKPGKTITPADLFPTLAQDQPQESVELTRIRWKAFAAASQRRRRGAVNRQLGPPTDRE